MKDEVRAARVKLAFVPFVPEDLSGKYWWPAIVYASYADALAERRETLSPSISEIMVLNLLEEHKINFAAVTTSPPSTATIAQFLGFRDTWLEFTEQQSLYAYLPMALSQKLPSRYEDAFNLALEQVKGLIGCDAEDATRIHHVLKSTKFVHPLAQQQTTTNTTTRPAPAPVSSQKRANSDPTRIWGREKQPPKKEQHSARIKTTNNDRRHFQISKRKAPTAAKDDKVAKRARKELSSIANHRRQGTSTQNSRRSEDEFYLFKNVWAHLKDEGWQCVRAHRNPLTDWYYIRPDKDPKTGATGTDYFSSPEEVVQWARSVNYRKQVGVETTDESSAGEEDEQSRVSGTDADVSKAEETLGSTDTEDDESRRGDESSHASTSTASVTRRSFSKTWKHLVKRGWDVVEARLYHPRAESTWYFVRPNVHNVLAAKRGRDYFATPDELMDWVDENPYAMTGYRDVVEDRQRACMIPQSEGSGGDEPEVARAPKTRRITLSPAKKPSSKVRKGASGKCEPTKRITPLRQSKPSVAKTEWWHKETVPSFTEIWQLLGGKLQFRYHGGAYRLPKGAQSPGAACWGLDQEMRKFLCEHGIPNYDPSRLSTAENTMLMRWVTFANVPVTNANSIPILEVIPIPSDPMPLLKLLGVSVLDTGGYVWQHVTWASLEELRVQIRGLPDLFTGRGRHARPLNENQLLELRLWAALSTEPLPVFGNGCEDGEM